MKLYNLQVGAIGTNCYIMVNEDINEGLIVDPGGDATRILHAVEELKLKVAGIFVTHGHSDHIGALHKVRQATGAPVYMSAEDAPMLSDPEGNLSRWMGEDVSTFAPEKIVADGDVNYTGKPNSAKVNGAAISTKLGKAVAVKGVMETLPLIKNKICASFCLLKISSITLSKSSSVKSVSSLTLNSFSKPLTKYSKRIVIGNNKRRIIDVFKCLNIKLSLL